ncbi:MAG: NAD(P)H-binding protein [Solirubrobacterales bacterium]|nr:NAD(P)H-binding protein [Solirubrobacterales bacterium]
MRILVTGASGFIGSLLAPRLCSEGHTVRALGREPARVEAALSRGWPTRRAAQLEVVRGDALSGSGLDRALAGVEVAYYLIHSMEPSPAPGSFSVREGIAAENFCAAAQRAGVRRIVYLGGLVPRWGATGKNGGHATPEPGSRHLASREHVERVLLDGIEDSIALRASIVIGARSRSFRLLVRLIERMPVLALPAWQRFRTQPIDARDVIAMLAACATPERGARHLEIGGPDVLSYGEMLGRIAELMIVNRPALRLRLRLNLTSVTARVAAAIAGEDPELVLALMEGLQGDLLPSEDRAAELLGVRLHSFDAAVEHALGEWEQTERLAAR